MAAIETTYREALRHAQPGATTELRAELARAAHTQHAEYLDVLHGPGGEGNDPEWNAADYAHHLSRRARGLPLWFSLATYGTDAYRDAGLEGAEIALRLGEHPRAVITTTPKSSALLKRLVKDTSTAVTHATTRANAAKRGRPQFWTGGRVARGQTGDPGTCRRKHLRLSRRRTEYQ